jgi:hypothetical protein
VDDVEAAGLDAPFDLSGGISKSDQLSPVNYAMLPIGQNGEPHIT